MRKLLAGLSIVSCIFLEADMSLNHLKNLEKTQCLKLLKESSTKELWSAFLKGQSKLFLDSEFFWIEQADWWKDAHDILEIGSGNGKYLYQLANRFSQKNYVGIEKRKDYVIEAENHCMADNLKFSVGDAEELNEQLLDTFDIVIFRWTLQHLSDPLEALKNASKYLKKRGFVVIIDSFDEVHKSSPSVLAIDDALKQVERLQNNNHNETRKTSFRLLQYFDQHDSELYNLYEVAFSNIDKDGKVIADTIYFEGKEKRELYFNHGLLFLQLLNRTYHVSVDLEQGYNELQNYQRDPNAKTFPGMHFLVLKKIGS